MRFAWLVVLIGCSTSSPGAADDDAPGDGPTGNGAVFGADITDVVVEIDYETGQEPFTGPIVGMGDTFDLAQTNIDRLFSGKKTITLPRTLADMEDVGSIPDEELTIADLLDLAELHRNQHDAGATRTYYLLFVSGHYKDDGGVQQGVLGISLGTTGVIAMFKDVIRSTDVTALPTVVRFVEQSTIVHELSHSFGLVDNGVPMVTPHRDQNGHGAHCDNDKCTMFYLNEGASDAAAFVQQKVLTGNTILFDDHCLEDADAQTARDP